MQVRFFNIVWDTDGEDVELPTETTLDVELSEDEIKCQGADALSDQFGWCVVSFEYDIPQ